MGWVKYANALGTAAKILSALSCVAASNTEVNCKTIEGTGDALQFRLMTGGQSSNIFDSTVGYAPPTITALSNNGLESVVLSKLLTIGEQEITIKGTNFGPLGTAVGATYGNGGDKTYVAYEFLGLRCDTFNLTSTLNK